MIRLPRNGQLWLPGYMEDRLLRLTALPRVQPARVWVVIADHYEPVGNSAEETEAVRIVEEYAAGWAAIAERRSDSAGKPAQYTFFYPQEEYRPEVLDRLAGLVERGVGDVEVHIHHDREGESVFVDRMSSFIETLHTRHGLLRREKGKLVFGFIHGNWALDNSLPGGLHCGLNNEITLLRELGCYADFTMPSSTSPSQASMVNRIYWAVDNPARPKSYNRGIPVRRGRMGSGDLLMIPGPLGLRWRGRLIPRMESGELACYDPPTLERARRWLDLAPRIGEDVFLKLYTHGAEERNRGPLLQEGLDKAFEVIEQECSRRNLERHYVTAWGLRNAVLRATGVPRKPERRR